MKGIILAGGSGTRLYNEKDMKEAGIDIHFVQDNQSMSTKGVLRGLHFQKQYPQCKLVRAVRGTVFDVAVDLRSNSETYSSISSCQYMSANESHGGRCIATHSATTFFSEKLLTFPFL